MKRFVLVLMFWLFPLLAGAQSATDLLNYETQETTLVDGPIVYGAGLNDADRRKAWGALFDTMIRAIVEQRGQAALEASLTPRCMGDESFCTIMLDANFIGIANLQEARKVVLMIVIDAKDTKRQLLRVVCTLPVTEVKVCRDWSTGKLLKGSAP